ncbi:hypothetical protein [Pelagicoccus mobilis]|uniref:Uncharacterized protein n=1 Tax=Pelagicoccus mobilis TaxID=415221 RepID=A0A934VTY7_9BACT|nr:hypothetical protein [Pelagicoccus mobilis]MBK1880208.1 hypothetical protein [Pelagicoccus mobilis]
MMLRILISITLVSLALLSTADFFVVMLLGAVSIPAVVIVQLIIEFLARKITGKKETNRLYSIVPAVVASVAIILKLSIWVQPYELFNLVMGEDMPSSVEDFTFVEDAWTDYSVRFHCKISPEDLDELLEGNKFTKDTTYERLSIIRQPVEISINDEEIDPIITPTVYSYTIPNENGNDGWCSLTTNIERNRIYVVYSVD